MPARIEYQKGHKFEGTRLTFLKDWGKVGNRRVFLGVCDCGNFTIKPINPVKHGSVRSCGCLLSETVTERNKSYSVHGCYNKSGMNSYRHMISRCYNEEDPDYYNYGALGVKVCDRWLEPDGKGVINFFEDMGEKPDGYSLDRIDTYGDYHADNCKWSNIYDQAYNKKARPGNKTGKTGVMKHRDGGYIAHIGVNGEKIYLGWFTNYEEAVIVREEAEMKYRGKILKH